MNHIVILTSLFGKDDDEVESEVILEDDDEMEFLMRYFITIPRNSIPNYFETVVSTYSDDEFIRHFRVSREIFKKISDEYEGCANKHLLTSDRNRSGEHDRCCCCYQSCFYTPVPAK